MRIAIVQREDARDITVHSGVYYFMAQSLAKHVGQVVYLCPDRSLISLGILNLGRLFNYASRFLFRRRLSANHNRILAKRLARVFGKRLKKCKCDVVFAPNASVEIANIKSDVPIIYRTDLNWADIVDYYPGSSSLFDFICATGEDIDAAAIRKAAAVIYPSDWAAHTATAHYGAPSEKIFSISHAGQTSMKTKCLPVSKRWGIVFPLRFSCSGLALTGNEKAGLSLSIVCSNCCGSALMQG